MAHYKAIVDLHPLTLTEAPRSLTFSSASDRIEIGRASKRQNKNLQPARHNALFDSRVMSRTHAILHASPEKKLIYIRDPGSMHGTLLNDKDITFGEEIVLKDGDELTFGVEVVRGSETFPPLRVRCACRWETEYTSQEWVNPYSWPRQRSEGKNRRQTSSNTFTVPEDDDDDCEDESDSPASHQAAVDLTTDQTSESNLSDTGSDSEDSRSVVEVLSPVTSPFKTDDSRELHPTESFPEIAQELPKSQVELSNGDEVKPKQPLATPRMSPPPANTASENDDDGNQSWGEYHSHSSDEGSNSESEAFDLASEEEDEGLVAEDDEESFGATSLLEPQLYEFDAQSLEPKVTSNISEAREPLERDISTEDRDAAAKATLGSDSMPVSSLPQTTSERPLSAGKPPTSSSQQQEHPIHGNPGFIHLTPLYSSFSRYDAQPAFRPPYLDNNNTLPPIMQTHQPPPPAAFPQLGRLPLQSPFSPYNDGPFVASPLMTGATAPRIESGGCPKIKPDYGPFLDPFTPMMPRISCDAARSSNTEPPPLSMEGPRPADFDLKSSSSKKRKAAEVGLAEEENGFSDMVNTVLRPELLDALDEDIDLPDGPVLKGSDSQLTAVSTSDATKQAKEDGRPSKKVKTLHQSSFKSHAATAVVAAMVGAVGTIAALASLPPDFFA